MNDVDLFTSSRPDGSPGRVTTTRHDTGRSSTRRARSSARRAELLAVAVRVFYEKGYAETTLQDIADAMGFTKPAIYYYASNKEELLLETYAQIVVPAIDAARRLAADSGSGGERFIEVIRHHLATFLDNIEANAVFEVQRASLSPAATEQIQLWGREYGSILAAVYQQGIDDGSLVAGDAAVAVNAVLGMCNTVHRWFHPGGRLGVEAVIEQLLDILRRGVFSR